MSIKTVNDLRKAYPDLANKIEAAFPNSISVIDKVLDFLDNSPQAEKIVKDLLLANVKTKNGYVEFMASKAPSITNKKESANYMSIKTTNDLKRAYPELVDEIVNDALTEERNHNLDKFNAIRNSIAAEDNLINIAAETVNKRRGNK